MNSLATPLPTRSSTPVQVATPRLKTNLWGLEGKVRSRRDPLGSVQEEEKRGLQEEEKRSESLEVHLSLPSNKEEAKWEIDARRLVMLARQCDA